MGSDFTDWILHKLRLMVAESGDAGSGAQDTCPPPPTPGTALIRDPHCRYLSSQGSPDTKLWLHSSAQLRL